MIRSENSRMLFWKETYMGQGSSIVFPSLVVQPPSFLLFAYVLPFFACAKKGTKKAQPILMLTKFSAEYFLCQNRHPEHNAAERLQDDEN